MTQLAALDVGSNTAHLLLCEAGSQGELTELGSWVEMIELSASLERSGQIGEEGRKRVEDSLDRIFAQAQEVGFDQLIAGATEAVRQAPDCDQLLDLVSERIGVPLRLISSTREAQLVFLGVAAKHARSGEWVIADVGGGSTELIEVQGGRLRELVSLPIGSGKLAALYLSDPPSKEELTELNQALTQKLSSAPGRPPQRLVVTGGTAHTLAVLLNKVELNISQLEEARQRLNQQPAEQLVTELGLVSSRIRALRGGVEILDQLLQHYQVKELEVAREGLRQGMLRAWLAKGEDWWKED